MPYSILFFLFWVVASPAHTSWQKPARRLTGQSDAVRIQSLKSLRAFPNLEAELTKALKSPDRYLALDVISALSLTQLVPLLLEQAPLDENGESYLALATLLDAKTRPLIVRGYLHHLRSRRNQPLSIPSQVIVLDTLARLGEALSESDLLSFVKDPDPDLRSAALAYASQRMHQLGRPLYEKVLEKGMNDRAYPIRVQTFFSLKEVPFAQPERWSAYWDRCKKDSHSDVRNICPVNP